MERTVYCWPVDPPDCEWWAVQPPEFSEHFKNEIKRVIPSTERDWNNVDKYWVVQSKWKNWTLNLAQKSFYGCQIEEQGG